MESILDLSCSLGRLIMLRCLLRGATEGACWWGEPLGLVWARKEGPSLACPCCKLPPPIWHRVAECFNASVDIEMGLIGGLVQNRQTVLTPSAEHPTELITGLNAMDKMGPSVTSRGALQRHYATGKPAPPCHGGLVKGPGLHSAIHRALLCSPMLLRGRDFFSSLLEEATVEGAASQGWHAWEACMEGGEQGKFAPGRVDGLQE
eukprot:1155460-Pelagomonas_calceolata.AAC.5